MKVKFLRDYHGPETNEFRHLQGAIVEFPDEVAENFIARKIVVEMKPATGGICNTPWEGDKDIKEGFYPEHEEVVEIEQTEPEIEVVKPVKIVTKRKPKKK